MRRGFTVAELLAAMLISGAAAGAVLGILFSCFKSLELHRDLAQATLRAELALAMIQPFVLNAGLGVPNARPGEFLKGDNGVSLPLVRDFERPVQLALSAAAVSSFSAAPALWTVYSVPGGRGTRNEALLTRGEECHLPLDGGVLNPVLVVAGTYDMKSWVTFPSAGYPLRVTRRSDYSLNVMPQEDCAVAAFDELHFVRAAKIFLSAGTLTIDRMDGSGAQPGVSGVVGTWFEFDQEGRTLTARVLARSEEKRSGPARGSLEEWPEDAVPKVADLTPGYRYVVAMRSWRVRN